MKSVLRNYVSLASSIATGGIEELRRQYSDNKAQTGTILAIVTGAITVLLGIIIFANIRAAMPPVNDTTANTTMDSVGTIFYSSVNLVVIGFIVLAAVFILAIVGRLRAAGE